MRPSASKWTRQIQQRPALRSLAKRLEPALTSLRGGADGSGAAGRMALSTFGVRVGGAALAYLSQILLARWMGAHEYGIYSVVWTWVIVLGIIACVGFSSSPNRFIPQYQQTSDFDRLRGFLFASRLIAFGVAFVLSCVGLGVIWLLRETIEAYYVLPAVIVMCALPLFAFGGVQDGIARSYDWPSLAMLPTYIWRPLAILVLVVGLMLLGNPVTALTTAMAAVGATWIVALYQFAGLRQRLKNKIPVGPRRIDLNTWLAISLPMLLVEGFLQLITSADVIMVSFWHDPDDVAIYFAASRTLSLVHFVYFAVRAASAHRFAQFVHTDDKEGLAAYVRQATLWTFWPSLAAGAGLLVVAPLLLSFFGKDFSAGYPLIAVLLIGVLARASVGPADALLNMTGHQRSCAGIYAATFGVNVLLNLVLIPQFGLIGAAFATSLAILFEAVCLATCVRKKLNLQSFIVPLSFLRSERAE